MAKDANLVGPVLIAASVCTLANQIAKGQIPGPKEQDQFEVLKDYAHNIWDQIDNAVPFPGIADALNASPAAPPAGAPGVPDLTPLVNAANGILQALVAAKVLPAPVAAAAGAVASAVTAPTSFSAPK